MEGKKRKGKEEHTEGKSLARTKLQKKKRRITRRKRIQREHKINYSKNNSGQQNILIIGRDLSVAKARSIEEGISSFTKSNCRLRSLASQTFETQPARQRKQADNQKVNQETKYVTQNKLTLILHKTKKSQF
jgi:hypothetical protein